MPMPKPPNVLFHPNRGVFLGIHNTTGEMVWSKTFLGLTGRELAPTYPDMDTAVAALRDRRVDVPDGVQLREVWPSRSGMATMGDCRNALLEPWGPDVGLPQ